MTARHRPGEAATSAAPPEDGQGDSVGEPVGAFPVGEEALGLTRSTNRRERPRQELTVDAALDGRLGMDDVRLDPAVLIHQAQLAESDGNPQLGANLRRAAELVSLPDAEVLAIYEALRPSRSSAVELEQIAASLAERGANLNAALIREAAAAYVRRRLVRR